MAGDKQKLLDFLDRKAFQPVLRASPDRYDSDADKRLLEEMKDKTRAERERYQDYEDAEKVRDMFMDDLSSQPAQHVHRSLHRLDLPALPDIKDEFLELCEELGVGPARAG